MGWKDDVVSEFLEPDRCLPAVGQGALAIECRESDEELLKLFAQFTDEYTQRTVAAERAFLHAMEGGCQVPIAGYASVNDRDEVELVGLVASPDGKTIYKETAAGHDPEEIGKRCAAMMSEKEPKH